LLIVKWIEPVDGETPYQAKLTPLETIQEWLAVRSLQTPNSLSIFNIPEFFAMIRENCPVIQNPLVTWSTQHSPNERVKNLN
jgi:hypothetical protein